MAGAGRHCVRQGPRAPNTGEYTGSYFLLLAMLTRILPTALHIFPFQRRRYRNWEYGIIQHWEIKIISNIGIKSIESTRSFITRQEKRLVGLEEEAAKLLSQQEDASQSIAEARERLKKMDEEVVDELAPNQ